MDPTLQGAVYGIDEVSELQEAVEGVPYDLHEAAEEEIKRRYTGEDLILMKVYGNSGVEGPGLTTRRHAPLKIPSS